MVAPDKDDSTVTQLQKALHTPWQASGYAHLASESFGLGRNAAWLPFSMSFPPSKGSAEGPNGVRMGEKGSF